MLFCTGELHIAILKYVPQVPPLQTPPIGTPVTIFNLHILQRLHIAINIQFMNFESWLDELIGDDTRATASKKADYAQSTISRQLSRGYLRPETVIALCRAYDRSPVAGLIETGYINDYELHGPDVEVALHKATNEQLLDEIMRRSDPQARYLFGNEGDDDVIGLRPDFRVVSEAHDSMPLSAVADDSPDEDEMRGDPFDD